MTKQDTLAKFEKLGIAPPDKASADDLERTYMETVQNMIREGHDLGNVSKADQDAANALITEAAAHEQVTVDMGGEQ